MSISVYPSYVGPTIQYRFASLYPNWLGNIIDKVLPQIFEEWLGGVVVLDATYGVAAAGSGFAALYASLQTGVLASTAEIGTLIRANIKGMDVQPAAGVTMLATKLTALYAKLHSGVINITASKDAVPRGPVDAEISDEEPKI